MPFEKGISGNPAGRPSGRQAFGDRARRYLEDYTIDDLIALTRDRENFGKLSVFDGIVIRQVAAALQAGGMERERLLDRVFGKPTNRIEATKSVTLAELVIGSYDVD